MYSVGIVKWFNEKKGYGFISMGEEEVFAHYKDIDMPGFKKLTEGQEVEFKITHGENGLKAQGIRSIKNADVAS